eukprot:76119_1
MAELDTVLLECHDAIFLNKPFIHNNAWHIEVVWPLEDMGGIFVEDLVKMMEFYPKLITVVDIPESVVDIPCSKNVNKGKYVVFENRSQHQVGIILERYHSSSIMDPVAKVGHLTFRSHELPPNHTDKVYGIGMIYLWDQYSVIKGKKDEKYEYIKARCVYLELKNKALREQNLALKNKNKEAEDHIKKQERSTRITLNTVLSDLGYEASIFLDVRKKRKKFRRVTCGFADHLFIQLKQKMTENAIDTQKWKKRGRYYTFDGLQLSQLGQIIGNQYVSIKTLLDPIPRSNIIPSFTLFMNKIKLTYNQTTHKLTLIYTRGRQNVNEYGQSTYPY